MNPLNISNHEELRKHLSSLIAEREKRSAVIVEDAKEVVEIFYHPAKIIKKTVSELAGDKDFRSDLIIIAVNAASGFLSRKVGSSAVSALLTLLIDKVSNKKNNGESPNILSKLISMISGKRSGQNKHKASEL